MVTKEAVLCSKTIKRDVSKYQRYFVDIRSLFKASWESKICLDGTLSDCSLYFKVLTKNTIHYISKLCWEISALISRTFLFRLYLFEPCWPAELMQHECNNLCFEFHSVQTFNCFRPKKMHPTIIQYAARPPVQILHILETLKCCWLKKCGQRYSSAADRVPKFWIPKLFVVFLLLLLFLFSSWSLW